MLRSDVVSHLFLFISTDRPQFQPRVPSRRVRTSARSLLYRVHCSCDRIAIYQLMLPLNLCVCTRWLLQYFGRDADAAFPACLFPFEDELLRLMHDSGPAGAGREPLFENGGEWICRGHRRGRSQSPPRWSLNAKMLWNASSLAIYAPERWPLSLSEQNFETYHNGNRLAPGSRNRIIPEVSRSSSTVDICYVHKDKRRGNKNLKQKGQDANETLATRQH